MDEALITAAEFEARLAALCRGQNLIFPRKRRDRHILFRSIAQALDATAHCSEEFLNEGIKGWLSDVGTGIDIDHVTLRRSLVDTGYLLRDAQGSSYQVHLAGSGEVDFAPAVASVDSASVVRTARLNHRSHGRKQHDE